MISLMARGARFLKETPCSFSIRQPLILKFQDSRFRIFRVEKTYPLVHVDGVLAGDDIRDGGALSLARGLLCRGHGYFGRLVFEDEDGEAGARKQALVIVDKDKGIR